jgi:hypothetical protein
VGQGFQLGLIVFREFGGGPNVGRDFSINRRDEREGLPNIHTAGRLGKVNFGAAVQSRAVDKLSPLGDGGALGEKSFRDVGGKNGAVLR